MPGVLDVSRNKELLLEVEQDPKALEMGLEVIRNEIRQLGQPSFEVALESKE